MAAELRVVGDAIAWKQTAGPVYEIEGVDEGATAAASGQIRLHDGELWYTAGGRERSVAGDAQTENVAAGVSNGEIAVNGNRLLWKIGDVVYSALAAGAGREWSDFVTASEGESVSDESIVTGDTVADEDAVSAEDGWDIDANPHPTQEWSDSAAASEGESVSDDSALSDDEIGDGDSASASDAWDADKAPHPRQDWSDSAAGSESESVSDDSALSDDTVSDGDAASVSDSWDGDTPTVNPTIAFSNANDLGFGLAQGEVRAGDDCESVRVDYTINGGTLTYLETINTTPNSATTHQTDSVMAFASDEVCFFFTPYSADAEGGVSGGAAMACVTLS